MAKPKRVTCELIHPKSEAGKAMYPLLAELVTAHHDDLFDARIALAWNMSWKCDTDGHLKLGKCKKASDLDREFAPFDFVILLSRSFYEDARVSDDQRRALIDHEISHATVKLARDGEPAVDERGRQVWRIRKHDVEEFAAIAERYGCWKRDLEEFARALRRAKQRRLPIDGEPETPDVIGAVMEAVATQSSDAGREFAEKMRAQAKKTGGSVTLKARGRSVTIAAAGAHPE
jgi:hypothetical protein